MKEQRGRRAICDDEQGDLQRLCEYGDKHRLTLECRMFGRGVQLADAGVFPLHRSYTQPRSAADILAPYDGELRYTMDDGLLILHTGMGLGEEKDA